MSSVRQLAAVMFTDIVGYTALMGQDEQKAFELLKRNRQIQKPIIEEFNGRFIKELGDGILASFNSVSDAIYAAIKIQQTCKQTNDLSLRIGIDQGEVIFEQYDIFGDTVNIASRIQAIAAPGGIYISESVYHNVSNKKDIQIVSLGKHALKNVKDPVAVFAVSNHGLHFSFKQDTLNKGYKHFHTTISKVRGTKIIIWVLLLFAIGLSGFLFIPAWMNKQRARRVLIPEIQQLVEANFNPPAKAFDLAKEAEKYIPNDSALLKLWPKIAWPVTVETDPLGANIYWKDYNDTSDKWKLLGTTPLKNVWIPKGFCRFKVEKQGFQTIFQPAQPVLKLDSMGKLPADMVKVYGEKSFMNIVGLEHYGGKHVSDFLVDKYEVTNKEFKRFVDAGGYKNKKYWDYPFYSDEKEMSWEQAISLFHDRSGKHGPVDWEVGTYPDGKEEYPVTGISWYEAMAYAKFVGKTLPNVYQWSLVANTGHASEIIPLSNFTKRGISSIGTFNGISNWGVYDIAGNVREWCFNESDKKGWRYNMGGAWNDPTYAFNEAHAEPAMNRSLSNGFRCVKLFSNDSTYHKLSVPTVFAFRDYNTEKPVDDDAFNIFLRQYAYDRSPLNASVTTIFDSSFCKMEKIHLDAAYNKEQLTVYLFLPKNVSPPFQTIVYFPHAGAIYLRKFDPYNQLEFFDFILKSGRAVLYPVFKGTFERESGLKSDLLEETVFFKEHVISWAKDISRAQDYLETRKDIEHNNFGYMGYSWGGEMGAVMCAVEPRFKAAIYNVGGLMMQRTFPEVDPLNFLPRVKIPVLMLNGKNDSFFPVETSQKPMFRLLGTPEKDKRIIIYEGGHQVPRSELVKEALSWFDKYLGAVK